MLLTLRAHGGLPGRSAGNFFLFKKFWTERKFLLIDIHTKGNLLRFIARELELEERNGVRKKTEK